MEEAIKTLEPRFAPPPSVELKQDPTLSNPQPLENLFAALDVEELAESYTMATSHNLSLSKHQTSYEFKLAKGKKDAEQAKLFALFCLFEDLNRIRTSVSNVWKKYKEQEIDLITASVTTNTAIQLAIRVQSETLAAFPKYRLNRLAVMSVLRQFAETPEDFREEDLGDRFEPENIAQWIFGPVYLHLKFMKQSFPGPYNPKQIIKETSLDKQFLKDADILAKVLPELNFMAQHELHRLATDELTKGLWDLVSTKGKTKEIPIWLTFATAVFLDIHQTLQTKVHNNYLVLQDIATRAQQTLKRHFKLVKGPRKAEIRDDKHEKELRLLVKQLDFYVRRHPFLLSKGNLAKAMNQALHLERDQFYLYKRHPILCGITAFRIKLRMHDFGLITVNNMSTAVCTAHLYNFLRHKRKPIHPWPLMDQVIELHGESKIFVGAKPTTLINSFKHFGLVLGVPIETFARNKRTDPVTRPLREPRYLGDTSAIIKILREAWRRKDSASLTIFKLERQLLRRIRGTKSARVSHSYMKAKPLPSLELIERFKLFFPAQVKKLEVDYFLLYQQSIGLLRRLQEGLEVDLWRILHVFQPDGVGSFLSHLAFFNLHAAIDTKSTANTIQLSKEGNKLIKKTGKTVDKFFRERSGSYYLGGCLGVVLFTIIVVNLHPVIERLDEKVIKWTAYWLKGNDRVIQVITRHNLEP
jgi:Family of unknown function (DUF6604)